MVVHAFHFLTSAVTPDLTSTNYGVLPSRGNVHHNHNVK